MKATKHTAHILLFVLPLLLLPLQGRSHQFPMHHLFPFPSLFLGHADEGLPLLDVRKSANAYDRRREPPLRAFHQSHERQLWGPYLPLCCSRVDDALVR